MTAVQGSNSTSSPIPLPSFRFLIITTTSPPHLTIFLTTTLFFLHIISQSILDSSRLCYFLTSVCLVDYLWPLDSSISSQSAHNFPLCSSVHLRVRNPIPFPFCWTDQPLFEVVSDGVSSRGLYVSLKRTRLCGGLWVLFVYGNFTPLNVIQFLSTWSHTTYKQKSVSNSEGKKEHHSLSIDNKTVYLTYYNFFL